LVSAECDRFSVEVLPISARTPDAIRFDAAPSSARLIEPSANLILELVWIALLKARL